MIDLTARVAELEAEVARLEAERDAFKLLAAEATQPDDDAYTTPTAEEVHEMFNAPRGKPLDDILAEFGLDGVER